MNKIAKIAAFLVTGMTIISSCTNNDTPSSPYDKKLAEFPYGLLTDSIKQFPKDDNLYFRRAVMLNENNETQPALADFRKAWSLKKQEKYALGISTLLIDSKPADAIPFLEEALKALPNSTLLRLSLAHAYDAQQRTDDALAVCRDILQHNPQQVDVMKMGADLLEKKGQLKEAIALLEKGYALVPYDVQLNYMLALKYAEDKNGKVLTLCDSLIKTDSADRHAEPYYYKGIYYSNTGNPDKALAAFDMAIKTDINYLDGYIEKASLLFDRKQYNDAMKTLNLLLTIKPDFPDTYYWLAKCQQAQGLKDDARINYLRAYGLDQSFTSAKDSADKLK